MQLSVARGMETLVALVVTARGTRGWRTVGRLLAAAVSASGMAAAPATAHAQRERVIARAEALGGTSIARPDGSVVGDRYTQQSARLQLAHRVVREWQITADAGMTVLRRLEYARNGRQVSDLAPGNVPYARLGLQRLF